jgi:hypothetical protein
MSALWKAAITRVLHKAMRPHGPVTHTNFAWNRGASKQRSVSSL